MAVDASRRSIGCPTRCAGLFLFRTGQPAGSRCGGRDSRWALGASGGHGGGWNRIGRGLGAQLFDWAARGNVRLALASGEWTLIQGERPGEDAYAYEQEAWDRLFQAGERQQVKPAEHHADILAATLTLQNGAEACFTTGKRRMSDARSAYIAMAVWLMGAACLLAAAVVAGRQRGLNAYGIAPLAIGAMIPAVVAAWLSGWMQRFYQVRSRRRNSLVAATILLCDAVLGILTVNMLSSPIYLAEQAAPMVAAGLLAAFIAPFVGRRSRYGHWLLCRLMDYAMPWPIRIAFPDGGRGSPRKPIFSACCHMPRCWAWGMNWSPNMLRWICRAQNGWIGRKRNLLPPWRCSAVWLGYGIKFWSASRRGMVSAVETWARATPCIPAACRI